MSHHEKIIEKIQKLLALSSSPSENEAASSLAKAHDLLQRYNLSMDDLKVTSNKTELITSDYIQTNRMWVNLLVSQIAEINYCGMYRAITAPKVYTIRLVGREHNVIAVKVMVDYVIQAIERGAKKFTGVGRQFIASYKLSFAVKVVKRLEIIQQEKEQNSQTTALVLSTKQEIEKIFSQEGLRESITRTSSYSSLEGAMFGAIDGSNLSLNDQLEGKSSSQERAIS